MKMAVGQIFTIGYGTRSPNEILERLKSVGVTYVIDVRSSPYSRYQPDFSREQLERSLNDSRIKYVFMGDLLGGRPKDADCYTDGKVDYSKTKTKDFFRHGLDRLKKAHAQGLRICLICSEAQPSQCHRAKLISAALVDEGVEVTHILPDGSRRSQADVIAELTKGQHSLFDEHFVSRNTYR